MKPSAPPSSGLRGPMSRRSAPRCTMPRNVRRQRKSPAERRRSRRCSPEACMTPDASNARAKKMPHAPNTNWSAVLMLSPLGPAASKSDRKRRALKATCAIPAMMRLVPGARLGAGRRVRRGAAFFRRFGIGSQYTSATSRPEALFAAGKRPIAKTYKLFDIEFCDTYN